MFGWAKPVPVNVSRLRHPRNEGVVVSLVGPATNMALAGAGLACVFTAFDGGRHHHLGAARFGAVWAEVVFYLGLVNVWLAVFNLIPLPPLDGSAVFERLLPGRWWPGYLPDPAATRCRCSSGHRAAQLLPAPRPARRWLFDARCSTGGPQLLGV